MTNSVHNLFAQYRQLFAAWSHHVTLLRNMHGAESKMAVADQQSLTNEAEVCYRTARDHLAQELLVESTSRLVKNPQ